MTTFSVIIPVYNTGKELRRCVDSVLAQSYPHWECILVNDGSTDHSGAVCDALAGQDERIAVIHKENGGSSDARNQGIRRATGEYLLFLDSDDLWDDKNALEGLAQVIQGNPGVDVITFGVSIYEDTGAFVKRRNVTLPQGSASKESILRQLVYRNEYFGACYARALRRAFFQDADLFFTKGLISGEDIEWSARVMLRCKTIAAYPSVFYKRIRRSSGSITSAIGRRNILDLIKGLEMGLQDISNCPDPAPLKEIYLEYWAYQYAMLLALLAKIRQEPDYSNIVDKVKQYRYLLRYDHHKKVKYVRLATTILGFRGGVWILGMYLR